MGSQVVNSVKPSATFITQERFLSCVNDYVLREVSDIDKRLVAHMTLVRPDVVVMANVIGQLTGLHKSFPTAVTHIGLLPSVLPYMSDERAGLGEGLATDGTDAGFLSCVNAFMSLQSTRVTEGSLTVQTDVRFLPTVNPEVSLQVS